MASLEADPVKRVNSDQMRRVCLEANRHLDKYDAMAKEVNKLLGRIAPPAPVVPEEISTTHTMLPAMSDQLMAFGYVKGWNACRAAMLHAGNFRKNANSSTNNFREIAETSTNSPVTPDGWVMVPKRLTAENGAKGVLSGEFSETTFISCLECFGDDDCDTCDGSGRIEIKVPVTWSTIKSIWDKGIEYFAAKPSQEVK
ncbi:TPA: hypothetical protein ACHJD0_003738 [Escherichia coli]